MAMNVEKLRAAPAWKFAGERDGPLFKFRGFDAMKDLNPEYQGYAASMLRDGLIYCASPFEMNDPWEGRPSFAAPDQPFDHPETKKFVEALLDGQPETDKPRWRALLAKVGLEGYCDEMQDMHRSNFKGFGIYSMSTDCGHPLQWGYYGSGHRGYCWILDNKIAPLSRAVKVEYEEAHPQIEWARWKSTDLVRQSFLIKAKHWTHEGEYRILLPQRDDPSLSAVAHNGTGTKGLGRYLRIPPEAIHGVIFGQDMQRAAGGAIVRLARQFNRKLEFRCALIHRRKFEMATRQLTDGEVEHIAGLQL